MEPGDVLYNCYFWLSITGMVIGCLHFSIRSCEQSRCLMLKCCGITLMERILPDGNVLPFTRNETLSM